MTDEARAYQYQALGSPTYLGIPVDVDAPCQYCLLFPLVTEDNKEEFDQPVSDALKKACDIFHLDINSTQSEFVDDMTTKDFHAACRKQIVNILSGPKCGFELSTRQSIDEDELFLMVSLSNEEAKAQLADVMEVNVPLKVDLYKNTSAKTKDGAPIIPTDGYHRGHFDALKEDESNAMPMFKAYRKDMASAFPALPNTTLIRLVGARMRKMMHIEALVKEGVVKNFFPVHEYDAVSKLYASGFSNPTAFVQYPGSKNTDKVRDYFGEQVGFFFQWVNFYTRNLLFPSCLAIAFFVWRRSGMADLTVERGECAFALIMAAWSSYFVSDYVQRVNTLKYKWGMDGYKAISNLDSYDPAKSGSCAESATRNFHNLLLVFMFIYTIGSAFLISAFRANGSAAGEKIYKFGLSGDTCSKLGKYALTANIKIPAILWDMISPAISKRENHKTAADLNTATINKLFVVKFFVYFFPFLYTAFVKEHVEGCIGGDCYQELYENLIILFPTNLVTSIAIVIVSILMTKCKITSEIKAAEAKNPGQKYTYLEAQAKFNEFTGDTDYFVAAMIDFAFICCFSVACPVMSLLCLVQNLIGLRLLGFQYTTIIKRCYPSGQDGIGAWMGIMKFLSMFGVVCTVGVAIMDLPLFAEYSLTERGCIFLAAEHGMLIMSLAFQGFYDPESKALREVKDLNRDIEDELLGSVYQSVDVTEKATSQSPWKLRIISR
jgi:hypothetical protein